MSLLSQVYRYFLYSIERPKIQLQNGMFVISIDVDVGSKELGIKNRGVFDANINARFSECEIAEAEEVAFPLFADLFDRFEVPVTFAIRGQMTEVDASILKPLLESRVKHDIGAHGYYHKQFTNLAPNDAENELQMTSAAMKEFGIVPRSFIFPRNEVAHLGLLEKYGYKCYRGSDFCMNIEKIGSLYDVHPSFFLDSSIKSKFLMKMLDICVKKRAPFHVWFHLWNFGFSEELIARNINRLFRPLFEHAQQSVRNGTLTFETMLSATQKAEKLIGQT